MALTATFLNWSLEIVNEQERLLSALRLTLTLVSTSAGRALISSTLSDILLLPPFFRICFCKFLPREHIFSHIGEVWEETKNL
jgi:hypothetical protein